MVAAAARAGGPEHFPAILTTIACWTCVPVPRHMLQAEVQDRRQHYGCRNGALLDLITAKSCRRCVHSMERCCASGHATAQPSCSDLFCGRQCNMAMTLVLKAYSRLQAAWGIGCSQSTATADGCSSRVPVALPGNAAQILASPTLSLERFPQFTFLIVLGSIYISPLLGTFSSCFLLLSGP